MILGHNGAMKVYTFVAQYDVPSFRGDLMNFFKYLESSYGLDKGLYLQKVQAGTEVFTGSSAVLTTPGYTVSATCSLAYQVVENGLPVFGGNAAFSK